MRSFRRFMLLAIAAGLLAFAAVSPALAASPRAGALHLTKECSQYGGEAGGFCTFTSSNLRAIPAGSRVVYLSPAGATGLDTDVRIEAGRGTTAAGHCVLSFATGLGACRFWSGTGRLSGFHARVTVSYLGGPNWAWDGTYRFVHSRGDDD